MPRPLHRALAPSRLARRQSVPTDALATESTTPAPHRAHLDTQARFGNEVAVSAIGVDATGLGALLAGDMLLDVSGVDAGGPVANTVMLRAWRDAMAAEIDVDAPALRQLRPSGGVALASRDLARFEAAFDHDFDHVRVHVDAMAAAAAEALHAHAFALGSHVFFSAGAFAPGTPSGDRLLAHELTHVQQADRGALPSGGGVSSPTDRHEVEAYANEERILGRLQPRSAALDLAVDDEVSAATGELAQAEETSATHGAAPEAEQATAPIPEVSVSVAPADDASPDGASEIAHRDASGPGAVDRARAQALVRASRGAPLPPAIEARMAAALGHDLGHVRVHTDHAAARAADALNAHAFQLGAHVYFAAGAFAPDTAVGRERLAHELTHVVQHDQGRLPNTGAGPLEVSSPEDAAEREAVAAASALAPVLEGVDAGLGDETAEVSAAPTFDAPAMRDGNGDDDDGGGVGTAAPAPVVINDDDEGGPPSDDTNQQAPITGDPPGGGPLPGGATPTLSSEPLGGLPTGNAAPPSVTYTPTVAPAAQVAVPAPPPIMPVRVRYDRVSAAESERWVAETGRGPAEHQRQIQGALDTLTGQVTQSQSALVSLGTTRQGEVISEFEGRAAGLQTEATNGVSEVVGAFDALETHIVDQEREALAAVERHVESGTTSIGDAQTRGATALDGAFGAQAAQVEAMVTEMSPPLVTIIQSFATDVAAEGVKYDTKARERGKELSAEKKALLEPLKTGAGAAPDRNKALDAVTLDTEAGALEKLSVQQGTSLKMKTAAYGQNVDALAAQHAKDQIQPHADTLAADLLAMKPQIEERTREAREAADTTLRNGAGTAREAITSGVVDARAKLVISREQARKNAEEAGTEFVENSRISARELGDQILRRANEDAAFYAALLQDLQRALSGPRARRYEDVQPLIARARATLDEEHPRRLAALEALTEDPADQLEKQINQQREVFAEAVRGQKEETTRVRGELTTLIHAGAERFQGSLAGIAQGYTDKVDQEVGAINTRINQFSETVRAGMEEQANSLKEKLAGIEVALGVEFDMGLTNLPQSAANAAQEELVDKQRKIRLDRTGKLRDAMDGLGTDEDAIYDVLRDSSPGEIEALKWAYKDRYPQRANKGMEPLWYDLWDELTKSELDIARNYLGHNRANALALELKDSTRWYNDDEERIKKVLRSATDEEIGELHKHHSDVLDDTRDALGSWVGGADADQDAFDALIELGPDGAVIPQAERHLKADAIDLFGAMKGPGTDEDKIKEILKNAKTPEEREKLRAYYETYATGRAQTDWFAHATDLDSALMEEFGGFSGDGADLKLVLELANVDRDDKKVKILEMLDAGDGAGTDEKGVFEGLEDDDFNRDLVALESALASATTDEDRAAIQKAIDKLVADRLASVNAMVAENSEYGDVDAFFDDELEGGRFITTLEQVVAREFTAQGKTHPITASTLENDYLLNMDRLVANRVLRRGKAEEHVMIKWAVFGLGTDEQALKDALSDGGRPKSRSAVNKILDDYQSVWMKSAATKDFELKKLGQCDTQADVEKLADKQKRGGPGGVLSSELSGDDWMTIREFLFGAPETPKEAYYIACARYAYENSGLGGWLVKAADLYVNIYSAGTLDFTDKDSDMEAAKNRTDEAYADVVKLGVENQRWEDIPADPATQEFQWLCEYLREESKAFGKFKAAVVDGFINTLQIIAGVIISVVTAGAGSPVLAAVIANICISAVGIGLKYVMLGAKYGMDDLGVDLIKAFAAAVTAGVGAHIEKVSKIGEKAANTIVGQATKEAVEQAGGVFAANSGITLAQKGQALLYDIVEGGTNTMLTGMAGEVINTLVSEETYEGKIGDKLWGEDSLATRLLYGMPKDFAQGGISNMVDTITENAKPATLGKTVMGKTLSATLGETAGFLVYAPNYADATTFWDNLLKGTATAAFNAIVAAPWAFVYRNHKLANEVAGGEVTPAQLEAKAYLSDQDRIAIAERLIKKGMDHLVPDSFRALYDAQNAPKSGTSPSAPTTTTTTPTTQTPVDDRVTTPDTNPSGSSNTTTSNNATNAATDTNTSTVDRLRDDIGVDLTTHKGRQNAKNKLQENGFSSKAAGQVIAHAEMNGGYIDWTTIEVTHPKAAEALQPWKP